MVEEVAQPELGELLALQVRAQPEHVGEVVRTAFDGGFADLERGRGHRVRVALQHHEVAVEHLLALLVEDLGAGESPAEHHHVAGGHGVQPARCMRAPPQGTANSPLGSCTSGGLARMLR